MTGQEAKAPRGRLSTTTVVLILLGSAVIVPILGYGVLAVWFFSRSPRVEVDYLAEMNADLASIPESDRAAPIVVEASYELHALKDAAARRLGHADAFSIPPDSPDSWLAEWPTLDLEGVDPIALQRLIDDAEPTLARVRAAAARDRLGWEWENPKPGSGLWNVLLPYLGSYRNAVRWLAWDVQYAATKGDADEAVASVFAIERLGRQLADDDATLVSQMVAVAVAGVASNEVLNMLEAQSHLLSDTQLAAIAEALDTELELRLEGEYRFYQDAVQRVYAPGDGGRITAEGVRLIMEFRKTDSIYLPLPYADRLPPRAFPAALPLAAPMMATRGESLAHIERVFANFSDRMAQKAITPEQWQQFSRIEYDPDKTPLDPVADLFAPTMSRAASSLQHARTTRGAALLTLAAHRFRLDHGQFPESAEDLVPSYLDEVPLDRFTGEPMRYRLTPDGPLIYVSGPDLDDDGGAQPASERDEDAVQRFNTPPDLAPDGDWILFPPR